MTPSEIASALQDARTRTLALVEDLTDEQLMGPQLAIVNPMLWEIGHVAWFHERWSLRQHLGRDPIRADGDSLYDSSNVHHDTRWDLPLPTRAGTLDYMSNVHQLLLDGLTQDLSSNRRYFYLLGLFHEDMHDEAFTYTRHTHGWPLPSYCRKPAHVPERQNLAEGDAFVRGATFLQGASPDASFSFDNERQRHEVTVGDFHMAKTQTTIRQFSEFVRDGGYSNETLWDPAGWTWVTTNDVKGPAYWKDDQHRWYDTWLSTDSDWPMIFVNWFEASAYCRWAKRRLPTESEWELAAANATKDGANLDASAGGPVDVHACEQTDTPEGIRQLFGNIWEFTSTDFEPYAGFVPDPYEDYSKPWFGTQKVLRGGCWATRSRMVSRVYRNFYEPQRRDVWGGFRTCAL